MATAREVARDLLGSMGSDENMLLAVKWIDNRYKELVSRVRFNHLRKIGELRTEPVVNTGTVAATDGSTSITGTSTTWLTSPGAFATGINACWALRVSEAWYSVDVVTNDTSLTLATAFSEDNVTAASYSLVKRYHALATGARWLGQFIYPRLGFLMGEPIALDELDMLDAARSLVGMVPGRVALVGTTPSTSTYGYGRLLIEVYPYPTDAEILKYVYWDIPSALSVTTTIPPQIDGYVLKEGAYIDYCRWMMAKREMEGKWEAAAFWRNEMNTALTRWDRFIAHATRTDRAVDDYSFIMQRDSGSAASVSGDIKTAWGHWLAGYTR